LKSADRKVGAEALETTIRALFEQSQNDRKKDEKPSSLHDLLHELSEASASGPSTLAKLPKETATLNFLREIATRALRDALSVRDSLARFAHEQLSQDGVGEAWLAAMPYQPVELWRLHELQPFWPRCGVRLFAEMWATLRSRVARARAGSSADVHVAQLSRAAHEVLQWAVIAPLQDLEQRLLRRLKGGSGTRRRRGAPENADVQFRNELLRPVLQRLRTGKGPVTAKKMFNAATADAEFAADFQRKTGAMLTPRHCRTALESENKRR
jgi:hypothetical protein